MLRLSVVVLGLLVLAPPAPAAERCGRLGGPAVAENARVKVVRIAEEENPRVIGCSKRTGRRTVLDRGTVEHVVARTVRVAGRFAALDSGFFSDRGTSDVNAGIAVWDVEAGRQRASWTAFVPNLPDRPAHQVELGSLVVSPRGSAAFTLDDEADGVARVHRLTLRRTGRHRVLDPGPGVDARSLRRDGTRVRWRRGGATRSASLP